MNEIPNFWSRKTSCSTAEEFWWIIYHLMKNKVPLVLTNSKYTFNTLEHREIEGSPCVYFTYTINPANTPGKKNWGKEYFAQSFVSLSITFFGLPWIIF